MERFFEVYGICLGIFENFWDLWDIFEDVEDSFNDF